MELGSIELKDHQREKLGDILNEITAGRKRIILKGSAGVGKTTLVNFILMELEHLGEMHIAAPTHKALSVLKSKVYMDEDTHKVVFCTVHSGLKLRQFTNKETGERYFAQSFRKGHEPFKNCKLLIVDEASMINDFLLELLDQYNFPIIFVGDDKQINPVKELVTPVFNKNWYVSELTEIIRQGVGNPIIEISRNLKDIGGEAKLISNDPPQGYVYTVDRSKIIERLAEVNGTDDLKYLAWTNVEVDTMNFAVRKKLYGPSANLIEEGESLIVNKRYEVNQKEIYNNNEEITVESLETRERVVRLGHREFSYLSYVINDRIFALHETEIHNFRQDCRELKKLAFKGTINWESYNGFEERFLDFKYNHAITVHKSQGSTYKNAIINIEDINKNLISKEKTRLLYTAVTRASHLVIFYKAPKYV